MEILLNFTSLSLIVLSYTWVSVTLSLLTFSVVYAIVSQPIMFPLSSYLKTKVLSRVWLFQRLLYSLKKKGAAEATPK